MKIAAAVHPLFESKEDGSIVLNLPFDDGSFMAIVLGKTLPDFQEWLASESPRKALCAKLYFMVKEGHLPSRSLVLEFREQERSAFNFSKGGEK